MRCALLILCLLVIDQTHGLANTKSRPLGASVRSSHSFSLESRMTKTILYAKSGSGNAASRRRERRRKDGDQASSGDPEKPGASSNSIAVEEPAAPSIIVNNNNANNKREERSKVVDPALIYANKAAYQSKRSEPTRDDGTSSIEDMFGLGNDQLRELMETELPVPREDLISKQAIEEKDQDQDKVFALPDLSEFLDSSGKKKSSAELQAEAEKAAMPKVDRSNQDEYLRALQLNPFADADDTLFTDEYDIIPSIFGSGKLLGIPVPYLQTGHGILLIVCVLAGFVYAPGNPLTEFPLEIRSFLKQGLGAVYSINTVLAVQAFFSAKAKNLPAAFWAAKTFVLGGVAYYEVKQATDPTKPASALEDKSYLSDRKSQNRDSTQFKR